MTPEKCCNRISSSDRLIEFSDVRTSSSILDPRQRNVGSERIKRDGGGVKRLRPRAREERNACRRRRVSRYHAERVASPIAGPYLSDPAVASTPVC